MSKIVIVVPSYNCEAYVAATLQSLLAQGPALAEVDRVIITDDCSKDRTIQVARETWRGSTPMEVYDSPVNRGEYRNMNECIARLPAHIEWYLVMHADNLAKPGWLEALLERIAAADGKVGTICTSWDNLEENGMIIKGENRQPPTPERIVGNAASVAGTIRKGCWWHISSCATRVKTYREIGGLPPGFRLKGDWDFLMRLLGAGWDVEYLPRALMTYRMNPTGSSNISFRRHRDVYETISIMQRHHLAMTAAAVAAYHTGHLGTLGRRLVGGVLRGHFERAWATVPASFYVIWSLFKCLHEQWLGRRSFRWVSSSDPMMESQLQLLSTRMGRFYSEPATRDAYQAMVDAEASAQPITEGALRKAVLDAQPQTALEVGCGSGRIYKRLLSAGFGGVYTGLEMSPKVIADNQRRLPGAVWICGSGYDLCLPAETQDCVFSYYVLEHCAFPERFLNNLLRVVKPGGRLLLTFPDMKASHIFGSQALGWDDHTAREHVQSGRIFHALVRLLDSRFRLPCALQRAGNTVGPFPVNLTPQCLEPGIKITPDVDAIYAASRDEVRTWAEAKGCTVHFPGGTEGILRVNVLIEIVKPVGPN
ncbi:MAG: glycosyltransferase [Deltaproteobacteria bacterium]|nr:glycosyltransferase [Deltaproteobacteria bacterium]